MVRSCTGCMIQRNTRHLRDGFLQTPDNFLGVIVALAFRFEIDLETAAVECGVGAVDTDK